MSVPEVKEITVLERIESTIEKSREGLYSILYISLSGQDYVTLGNEFEAMSGRRFGVIDKVSSYPVYIDVTQKSCLVLIQHNYIERMKL